MTANLREMDRCVICVENRVMWYRRVNQKEQSEPTFRSIDWVRSKKKHVLLGFHNDIHGKYNVTVSTDFPVARARTGLETKF
jgi:hypothetical protein